MCGIFGIVDFNGLPVEKNNLKKISGILSRRGPDDEGLFYKQGNGESVAFVHRRLSIIDLKTGKQPILNENGEIILLCNGEIYNFKEIRETLINKGHKFKTESDSEVILHAYEEYSFDCLEHLRGMFAFAIWDSAKKHLFIARDRVGKKPLFYYLKGDKKLVFSSEIRAMLQYGEVKRDINREALAQYLSYGYIPAPETAFEDIIKLNPGSFLVFSESSINKRRYWNLDFSNKSYLNEFKVKEEIRRLLYESVKLRMISDVPVGAFLSGGLDSSIITAIMSRETKLPVETFSVGFEQNSLNELPFARVTQKYYGCRHHEIIMKPDSFSSLPELIELFGEPHADSSALATFLLSKEAKRSISVTLVGEGSDEVFGGYKRYLYYRLGNYFGNMATGLSSLLIKRYKRWLGGIRVSLINKVLSKDFLLIAKKNNVDYELNDLFLQAKNFKDIDKALFVDTMFFLPYDLLVKLDVSTMAYGLEARAPFLDHKLIEFVAGLPPSLKLKGFRSKYILRKAFSNLLPPEILNREKTGFVVPVQDWFRTSLKDEARDILLSSDARKRGYFNMRAIEEMLSSHANSKASYGHEIWTLLVFEIWHRLFIDKT